MKKIMGLLSLALPMVLFGVGASLAPDECRIRLGLVHQEEPFELQAQVDQQGFDAHALSSVVSASAR